jgi:hypothetical protein
MLPPVPPILPIQNLSELFLFALPATPSIYPWIDNELF